FFDQSANFAISFKTATTLNINQSPDQDLQAAKPSILYRFLNPIGKVSRISSRTSENHPDHSGKLPLVLRKGRIIGPKKSPEPKKANFYQNSPETP
ncbi:MAG: hypothetical protein LBE61_01570, partial [Burkholderiaceae bacterium]|nr:hypothetical protein [Burkholderiaceae bacterium]